MQKINYLDLVLIVSLNKTQCTYKDNIKITKSQRNESCSLTKGSIEKQKRNLHPFTTSLMGNILNKERLSIKDNIGLALALTPNDSIDHVKEPRDEIEEDYDENNDLDSDRQELDDYYTRRLQKAQNSFHRKPQNYYIDDLKKSEKRIVIASDDEYEYVLESEEEEEEVEEEETPVKKIFSSSFITEEQNPNESNPFFIETNYKTGKEGSIAQMRAISSAISSDGNMRITEEHKEDSYIHPALDNSSAFSNLSAIFGKQTSNNLNLLSFKSDSFIED